MAAFRIAAPTGPRRKGGVMLTSNTPEAIDNALARRKAEAEVALIELQVSEEKREEAAAQNELERHKAGACSRKASGLREDARGKAGYPPVQEFDSIKKLFGRMQCSRAPR